MIKQSDVIEFFDERAAKWDDELVRSDRKINTILDNANVRKGCRILDVACGTGVLFDDYIKRGAADVTGIDISPEMVKIARSKYPEEKTYGDDTHIRILCEDAESYTGKEEGFDSIVVYNAFPHFPDPERLIAHLASLLKEDGVLTIAHGMSRKAIDSHHNGPASKVSNGLMEAEDLALLLGKYLKVKTVISDDEMYQVAGQKSDSEQPL